MDYQKIGFKAGLEIHQQLDTNKLFCDCQSVITEDIDYSFERFLRPTQSELGDVDKAALLEAKKNRRFLYTASDQSTCLVEADEEPPHKANPEAIDVCLTMALLMKAQIVDEIQFMRKIVIDGSNTSGFQRTGLLAIGGKVGEVGIQTIALEEDAARKLQEKGKLVNYGLDRLGIPLIEIATDPDIKNPDHAREIAEKIGGLLQATGKTKRGQGTIRQDLNISVSEGARVEIKGVQSLSSISKVLEKETLRQLGLLNIQKILDKRINKGDLQNIDVLDITSFLKDTQSKIIKKLLKKNSLAKGVRLPGFQGLLKQKDTRLGKEFAVHARLASGIGGIIHSDELPGYGIKEAKVKQLHKRFKTKKADGFVIVIGNKKIVDNALQAVIKRAKICLQGVQEEVRRVVPDEDTTEYMRPMPGAARMYPETDVEPVRITHERITRLKKHLPETPTEKRKRFTKDYSLNSEQVKQILASGYVAEFEKLVKQFPRFKNVIIRTFLNTFSELEKQNVDTQLFDMNTLTDIFKGLSEKKYSKEAIPNLLTYMAKNPDEKVETAIHELGLATVDEPEIIETIRKVVEERKEFVKERGMASLGPLMGVVMKELRGKADGKTISKILKKEINKNI